jgi:hypothetical protein
MAGEHRNQYARRVVTGVDAQRRSTITSDATTTTRLATDGYTVNHIWQATVVPSPVMAENTLGSEVVIPPPPGGYTYLITSIPPDHEWDYEKGYAEALALAGAPHAMADGDIPGMHATDTVDIATVLTGEVWAVLESAETLLKPGDTIVQRGTNHAWQNRSDAPCELVIIHFGGVR